MPLKKHAISNQGHVSMGAVGASAPTVFGKFLAFASTFKEIIWKMSRI